MTLYDSIGRRYATTRVSDPRIEARIHAALGSAARVVNVGAGAGSYEPPGRVIAAVDPSLVMLGQRAAGAAPAVCGVAGRLPFADGSFDAAMATLTLHHWPDWQAGVAELRRVAARSVVFTFEPALEDALWLVKEYLPEIKGQHDFRFPPADEIAEALGDATVEVVRVPADCTDGFTGAFWARPEAYLDRGNRAGMSALAKLDQDMVANRMARLADDLASGAWDERWGHLREPAEVDLGYRLVSSAP
ncbi:MAG: class I SAM-dependent methyltransferase [Actinobacteria bacterium]|nr:class I SAM-dependent methyltransferase [Actinomycetota bacterium]